jgi:hypothetical protein
MITVRQLERMWQEKTFSRMSSLLLEMRPEQSVRLTQETGKSIPAAAMAIIRLDELSQSHTPFCSRLLRHILATQDGDGGWGDALTTALCIRALSCCNGSGEAISRGLGYLASLQKDDGSWPHVPLRRLPGDAFTTALVLFYLAEIPSFREAARCGDAINWLSNQEPDLDLETTGLCRRLRLRIPEMAASQPLLS